MSLKGKVAVVTGASRGIGRGIALQLGEAGAKVYVTGRKPTNKPDVLKTNDYPTLEEVAQDITKRGGQGIAVYVDHSDDAQVKALFDRIASENDGKLDILVNNAFAAADAFDVIFEGQKFWDLDLQVWDQMNNVGLRGHYVASVYGARLMTKQKHGLIVNVSSAGAKIYFFNVAYGVGKAGLDRLTADTAYELKLYNVAVVSLWPAMVKTENSLKFMTNPKVPDELKNFWKAGLPSAETPEYSGKAVIALANDPKVLEKTGNAYPTAYLGREYGFKDVDGRKIEVNAMYAGLLGLK